MMAPRERYYDLDSDVYVDGRWYLIGPTQNGVDISAVFKRGARANVAGAVRLGHSDAVPPGKPIDYTVISGDRVPVVSARVAEMIERLAPKDVELIPATVDGFSELFFVVNVLTVRRCIDEAACGEIEKFTMEEDGEIFADRIGRYRHIWRLKIDKTKVEDAKVFWTWGWGALIVAEDIKQAFEAARVTGAKFVEV